MDFEAQRKKRMEDLAIKRKRLEEMRKQRSAKNSTAELTPSSETASPPQTVSTPPTPPSVDVDDLVNSLLSSDNEPSTTVTQEDTIPHTSTEDTPPPTPTLSRLEHTKQRSAEWTTCQNVCSFTILPVVTEMYDKGSQTEASTDTVEDEKAPHIPPQSPEYHRTPQRSRHRSRGDSTGEDDSQSPTKAVVTAPVPFSYTPEDINDIVVGACIPASPLNHGEA